MKRWVKDRKLCVFALLFCMNLGRGSEFIPCPYLSDIIHWSCSAWALSSGLGRVQKRPALRMPFPVQEDCLSHLDPVGISSPQPVLWTLVTCCRHPPCHSQQIGSVLPLCCNCRHCSLQHEAVLPGPATLELMLVEDVKVSPNGVSIYNHPDIQVRSYSAAFQLQGGKHHTLQKMCEETSFTRKVPS